MATKPKSEMTSEELEAQEKEEFQTGPLSVLTDSVKNNTQILINCRNNRKLLARVKAFDRVASYYGHKPDRKFSLWIRHKLGLPPPTTTRHCNMVLENVKEMWTETPKTGKGKKKQKPVNRDRFISKMFIRGDSIIIVLKNPLATAEKA